LAHDSSTLASRFADRRACSGAAFQSIATQIEQASDIMKDGTNGPGPTCDGISVGIGFDGDLIGPIKTVGPKSNPPPDPCDAGGGG
jgi:hypothetical protein